MNLEVVDEETKQDKWFHTHHLQSDLKANSVKGGINTMVGQIILFVMNTSQTIIMARLLLPEDYGLIAMVSSITGFITIFKDLGLSSAVIQKEKLTQGEVSSVFWVNVLISFGIAMVVALLTPAIVYFYEEPRLLQITLVFALNIFIVGLSLQHNALMKRQMQFKSIVLIQVVAVGVNIAIGIVLAWLGFGYWTLLIQGLIYAVIQTVAYWIVCDWRPDFGFRKDNVGSYLRFGAGVTGFDVVNHFARNMDNVLIGKFVGSVALGLYTKAYQLLMLPITQLRNPLNSVALPALSSLQNDRFKFRSFYVRYLFILAFFSMPVVIYLGVFSHELILIVLGQQWIEAGIIFQLLAIPAFIQPVASTCGLIMITTGKVKKYFYIGLINSIITVAGFAIGVQWGVIGVAVSYALVTYLLFLPQLYFTFRDSPVSVSDFLKEIALPALFSLLSGAAMFYFRYTTLAYNLDLHALIICMVGFAIGAVVYLLLWFVSPASKARLMQIIEIGTNLVKQKLGKRFK